MNGLIKNGIQSVERDSLEQSQLVFGDDRAPEQPILKELSLLESSYSVHRYRRGDHLFYAGEAASAVVLIAQGQVKLLTHTAEGNERIVAIHGPGDLVGEAFLMDGASYPLDAVAISEVTTYAIDRDVFLEALRQRPQLALEVTKLVTGYLLQAWQQLADSYDSVKVRLAKVLLQQASRYGKPLAGAKVALRTDLSHEEIAAMISSTRVSVSATMAELRQEGAVEGTRGNYLLDLTLLSELADAPMITAIPSPASWLAPQAI
jgi:CRP-like cAMP-binding protein